MSYEDYVPWSSGIATILGVWAILAPFLWSATTAVTYSNVAAGVVVAVLAGFSTYRAYDGESIPTIPAAVAIVGALWLVAAPFALGIETAALTYSNVATGVGIALSLGFGLGTAPAFDLAPGRPAT